MLSEREWLCLTVEHLKKALEARKVELEESEWWGGRDPYLALDANGRSILLDALTALVNAQAVLVASRASVA